MASPRHDLMYSFDALPAPDEFKRLKRKLRQLLLSAIEQAIRSAGFCAYVDDLDVIIQVRGGQLLKVDWHEVVPVAKEPRGDAPTRSGSP